MDSGKLLTFGLVGVGGYLAYQWYYGLGRLCGSAGVRRGEHNGGATPGARLSGNCGRGGFGRHSGGIS